MKIPRLDSFDPKQKDTLDAGRGQVGQRGGSEGMRAQMPKKKRPLFSQRYYQPSPQHPDNLAGNPDSRREIE